MSGDADARAPLVQRGARAARAAAAPHTGATKTVARSSGDKDWRRHRCNT